MILISTGEIIMRTQTIKEDIQSRVDTMSRLFRAIGLMTVAGNEESLEILEEEYNDIRSELMDLKEWLDDRLDMFV